MNRKMISALLIMLLSLVLVFPVMGVNEHHSAPLQADNDWDITTNPPHMFSMPTGNVGIGTSSPQNKLHLAGASSGPNPIMYIQQTSSGRGLLVNTTNGMCGIAVEAGNNGLRVLSAGGNGILIMQTELHAIEILQADDHGLYVHDTGRDGVHIENASGWAGYFNGSGYFKESVGIGTETPVSKLDIKGTETSPIVNIKNTGTGEGIKIDADQATALWIAFAHNDGIRITDTEGHGIYLINTDNDGLHIDNAGGHGIYIEHAENDGIHINQSSGWAGYFNGDGYIGGYLGIGTLTPTYLLEVNGSKDIVARFSGRVIGVDAVNDDEYVTKGQVKRMSTGTYFTPQGTTDPTGEIGDIAYDDNFIYIRTETGWKRSAFETWSTTQVNEKTYSQQ